MTSNQFLKLLETKIKIIKILETFKANSSSFIPSNKKNLIKLILSKLLIKMLVPKENW